MMTGDQLRQTFLDFFQARGHQVMPSSSLIPSDTSTLFTVAGMQQFVPYWRGEGTPPSRRITTVQKCARADDIDRIGVSPVHHSFYEMLGNFSIGDYFKREAIRWAWELFTEALGIDRDRLWVTVHPDDDEAPEIWHKEVGVPAERIVPLDDNWWGPVGETGPNGPDSEIHYEVHPDRRCGPNCKPGDEVEVCSRFIELWNLVFPQFDKQPDGSQAPLANRGIDTGAGFERVLMVLQGTPSDFETDVFRPSVDYLTQIVQEARPTYQYPGTDEERRAVQVMADHVRAVTFLIADGVMPSNEGRGYALRRFLRRAVMFGRRLDIDKPFLHRVVPVVTRTMSGGYPELLDRQEFVTNVVRAEEDRFMATLEQGSALLARTLEELKSRGATVIPGERVFELHDTYGFPKDLTAEVARDQGFSIDEPGFAAAMAQQRERSRASWVAVEETARGAYADLAGRTEFVGYDTLQSSATVLGILRDGEAVGQAAADDEVEIFLDHSPFYAEAGGQVGDRGLIEAGDGRAAVVDTLHPADDVHAQRCRIESGRIAVGDEVVASVDAGRRQAIRRSHTATHLLHHALRQVLGEHAVQSGSVVEPDRLRFDFSHYAAMTEEQMREVEEIINRDVLAAAPVTAHIMALDQAKAAGAIALFGEKYGEEVRMIQVGDFSRELCAGTHAHRTSDIGVCILLSEGSIGAGLRRIEGVTGLGALRWMRERERALASAAEVLRARPEELADRASQLLRDLREAQKRATQVQAKSATAMVDDLVTSARQLDDIRVIAQRVANLPPQALRELADGAVAKLGSGVVVLATTDGDKVPIVAKVSKDLVERGVHAGNLLREVAKATGGSGGGRPDFAQGGGRDASKVDEALALVEGLVREQSGSNA